MVDIHSHIIPAIDDGVQTLDESLELIRMEVSGGTTAFVATPHIYNEQEMNDSRQIAERLIAVRDAVDSEGIAVKLHAGAEVYPSMAIARGLDKGLPLTVNDLRKHMLVDLPMGALPMDFDQILFEVQARGITPIIAHPERNAVFQQDPKRLVEYMDRGMALQVNAGSLRGRYGSEAAGIAKYILRHHWAHFLASDAHKPREKAILAEAVTKLRETLSPKYLELITVGSGSCIVEGQTLPALPPPPVESSSRKKGILARFLSR